MRGQRPEQGNCSEGSEWTPRRRGASGGDRSVLERLHDALRDGDRDAVDRLLPALRERLREVAGRRVRGDAVEDVVQETLVILWRKRASVLSPERLLPFVFTVLRHRVGHVYRRAQRDAFRRDTVPVERVAAPTPAGPDPEQAALSGELASAIDAAIRQCSGENETYGRVLRLLEEGRSASEIRSALGDVPMATVYTRIHRARQRLREILHLSHQVEL